MINRQLYTMKFKSSRLKKFSYDIEIDYKKAVENGEIIAQSDNQILRTIRDVVVERTGDKDRILDRELLERYYKQIEALKKRQKSDENTEKINAIKQKIYKMCFIPEYITIVIEHENHYEYMFENGLKINGVPYYRLSSSAGQSRTSTVVFCSGDIIDEVNSRLDNGRNKNKKFSPSKFNAYKGVYGSTTKNVSTPRFCVVPDYESETEFMVNWVTETPSDEDDIIELKKITKKFNRWDGMGLISPSLAQKWAEELELDYIPAQWCIRQSFLKGMVCVFDFKRFCEVKNNDNYIVNSVYKDEHGNPIKVDLREVDLIITESQFKLWDSFNSLKEYIENCSKNNLKWGISLYSPKEPKSILKMNYQFLQTCDIKPEQIPNLCNKTVDWVKGVTSADIWYTILFLLGRDVTRESIEKFMNNSSNYWVKGLIYNHDLIHDKYFKNKIYNLIRHKIDRACMGDILLSGNFQTLVSDPYAMMEYLCGLPVKGLLNKGEYYSNYWNTRNVKVVDSMRAPLTYRSEHVKLNLVKSQETEEWYKYCYCGVIVNVHGHETDNWAGSDWDFDSIATTPDLIDYIYENEYPIVYNAPKPEKIVFNDKDLYKSDLFSFGSIIGSITNKSTTGITLLNELEATYGEGSKEYQTTLNRIKMCTKLQSAQIDKAKIGREVKGIPQTWVNRKYIDNMKDKTIEEKEFLKSILLDRHPYFFIYLYSDTKRKYLNHINGYDLSCKHKFGISLNELLEQEKKTEKQQEYIDQYYKYMPVLLSDSVMNNICKYIESVNFDIKNKLKLSDCKDISYILMRNESILDEEVYTKVKEEYKKVTKEIRNDGNLKCIQTSETSKHDDDTHNSVNKIYHTFVERMDNICSNTSELVDYLIRVFYIDYPGSNKDLLWNTYGKYICENLKDKKQIPTILPIPSENGEIKYLDQQFSLEEVNL